MSLGESSSILPHHQRNMREGGRSESELAVKKDLPRSRGDEVIRANHLGDSLIGIVDHHCELVGRRSIAFSHHEIAGDRAGEAAEEAVVERDRRKVDARPEGGIATGPRARFLDAREAPTAGAGIDRPVRGDTALVRRARRLLDFLPGADTRIDPPNLEQSVDRGGVSRRAGRLDQWFTIPIETEPGQAVNKCIYCFLC